MIRREELVREIENAILTANIDICPELCFKSIYGLPAKLQIHLCTCMLRRYLGIFEHRNPDIKSPRNLLDEVEAWVRNNMLIEGQDADFNTADNSFMYGLESLLIAYHYRGRDDLLATSCACSIKSVISAFGFNVWEADDPEGVTLWRKGEAQLKNSPLRNVASIAVELREWKKFVSLLSKKNISNIHDDVDSSMLNTVLDEWKQNEMLLMMHKIRGLSESHLSQPDGR